ncbi:MAG: hypothetical protein JKY55_03705 [Aliivibrio sp.]|uniref:hypothetical protein n=1 Tax=Aliivibrio sp. TaxID=1872443 RepID=UPI001A37846D|nr:hypothetical protein [Aliivibrio sp.]
MKQKSFPREIELNGKFMNSFAGYSKLSLFANNLFSSKNHDVYLDCSELKWFSGSMGALLSALVARFVAETGKRVRYRNLSREVRVYFGKSKIISEKNVDKWGTVIPVKYFSLDDPKEFSKYTVNGFENKNLPQMSKSLKNKFFEALDEIYSNASYWSKSTQGVYVSGQFFPKEKHLDYSIVDLGRGFGMTLYEEKGVTLPDEKAIDWAMKDNNTTKTLNIPGGIGLKIIRDFIEINGGKLQVVSHGGFWSFSSTGVIKKKLPYKIPGTVVNLVIDTSDTRRYHLREEISSDDIF